VLSPLTYDDPVQLGAYRLTARLGSGGMGTVYLARSAGGRTVALKTMHAGIAADADFRSRFRLEIDAARIIGGHHGATVVNADPLAETPWLATEYVLGPPLDDAVTLSGPLPEPSVRALGAALAGALAQLHASGVVHRDLKPSNVMITAYGPKIIDFGIARAAGDDRLTRTGAAAGTPAFMSPEQATGQEHTPTGDVFALAGVLTYAATGHGPFGTGQPADLLYRVRYADPDLTGVPDNLVPILTRCLSKDPGQRLTTSELAAQLHDGQGQFADHLPDTLLAEIARRAAEVWQYHPYRLPTPPDHALAEGIQNGSRPAMSRRKLLAVGGSSVLGLAAVGAGTWSWLRQDSTEPKAAPTAPSSPKWDLIWQMKTDYGISPRIPSAPLLLDNVVAVAESASSLQALDPKTGKTKWSDPDVYFFHQAATDGRQIYAIEYPFEETDPLAIGTVDLATGELKEPFIRLKDLRGHLFENQLLCATDSAVYVVGGRGRLSTDGFRSDQSWFLLALDSRTGKELWTQPLPARPDKSERLHFLSAQVQGEHPVLVQQSADGRLRLAVRNARTGKSLWNRALDGKGPAFSRASLAVDENHVYPAAGELIALNLRDGKVAWRFEEGRSGAAYSPPSVKDGVVYAVEQGRGVVSVRADSGTLRWAEKDRKDTATELDAPPVVGIKYVYSKSSSGLWAADIRSGVASRPFKAAGARYFTHGPTKRLIALGDEYTAGYPLQ
jgi:serine/threonine protein kinase